MPQEGSLGHWAPHRGSRRALPAGRFRVLPAPKMALYGTLASRPRGFFSPQDLAVLPAAPSGRTKISIAQARFSGLIQ